MSESYRRYPHEIAAHPPFSLRGGLVVALPTPFAGGAIDESALARLCARQADAGTSAVVVCGTTGEAPALSHAEQRRVVEAAAEAVGDRVPVIAGAGSANTAASVELARQAEEAGAAALLCVTPYYVRPTQEGIYRHMLAIHDAVNIPLILYDVPARTGCALADDTVVRLACFERVIGLKDAAGDVTRPQRLRPRLNHGFLLLSGDDATQADYRRMGGDGCISVSANIAPRLCARLHDACDRGDLQAAAGLEAALAPLHRALFVEANPTAVKYALSRMNLISAELRLPLLPLSAAHHHTVDAAVEAALRVELAPDTPAIPAAPPSCVSLEFVARALALRHEAAWS